MASRHAVEVGSVENSGPNTLVSFLRNAGATCTRIDLAVAFITSAGLEPLLYLLKKVASRGRVRLLTGLYQGFTEPKALRKLFRVQEDTGGRLGVCLSLDRHFHWKSYFLLRKKTAHVVIGSSNLTEGGLRRSGELNLVLTLNRASKQFAHLHGLFERQWETNAKYLSEEIINKYEDWRTKTGITDKRASVPIGKLLGGKEKPPANRSEVHYWRYYIDGTLSDEAESLLEEVTDWDRRNLGYCNTWNPCFRQGDKVVLFDHNDKSVQVVEIAGTVQTPVSTPDGKHFAAYKKVRGVPRRRLVRSRWKSLKAAGLLRKKNSANVRRRLSETTFERFVENLREESRL